MTLRRMTWALTLSLFVATIASARHQIVCSGEAAGGYAAFPDICRLKNGDLYCVFYSGYGHVSAPNDKWPKGGRIMAVRSTDNGKTWSKPVQLKLDSSYSFACSSPVRQLADGSLILGLYQKTVEKLEEKIEEAIAEIIVKMGLKKLPLLPARHTMHLMAKAAAVAVYEAAVENQRREE
jgi:hypothetical protein